jgi:hypothetical protein
MAEDLTGNPLVIESTGAKLSGKIQIDRIAWKNATTLGHTVLVVDGSGKLIFEDFASGATYNTVQAIGREYTGLSVSTLSSGKLYIDVDTKPKRF